MSQQQDQQHQQQQYANEMNPYQQIPRPPAAGFSSNYMKEQCSHQSLQEHLQRETGNLGSGFTDVPALNYPATPPPHNNYAASNQMINTPPPSMGGLIDIIIIPRAWFRTVMGVGMHNYPNYHRANIL